jgi:glycosyltransferase involved in cell wall biosynthesis
MNPKRKYIKRIVKAENPEVLVISSFPPRECGIATYTADLVKSLSNQFDTTFEFKICPLESEAEVHNYDFDTEFVLNVDESDSFTNLENSINNNSKIGLVVIQHEFGFFENCHENLVAFIKGIQVPVAVVFHTVLPTPDESKRNQVMEIANEVQAILVMTKTSKKILIADYSIPESLVTVIAHGTHLIPHIDKEVLKKKYEMNGRKVISTFGLLSSGKSIETTLYSLPEIIAIHPEVLFLIIGKIHPGIQRREGEKYRSYLENIVDELGIHENVKFVNRYLPLDLLLEYLQLSDIYLFTSKDRNQAVSGTFVYALSCGCPIVSTPIPHAVEVLKNNCGILFDFENSSQLAAAVNKLLSNNALREEMRIAALHNVSSSVWENAAIAHANLFVNLINSDAGLSFKVPELKMDHIKKMTTDFGIIQFARVNTPDINSGYTLDDNARALVTYCMHYEQLHDFPDLRQISIYLNFIEFCQQENSTFLNYVDFNKKFTDQNQTTNIADATGRAFWALGYLISLKPILPSHLIRQALRIFDAAIERVASICSTRSMAFMIKGLYYAETARPTVKGQELITLFADRLVQMYRHENDESWNWYESYMTYANSILPEALLCAWQATGNATYKEVAKESFDFLLTKIFNGNEIKVVSNKSWLNRSTQDTQPATGGEQPIDVAYTIMALDRFYKTFGNKDYLRKQHIAFSWFHGNNFLQQIIYNPCTGGCYDGMEEFHVNLNQGAESTTSYLMAHLTTIKIEQHERAFSAGEMEMDSSFKNKFQFQSKSMSRFVLTSKSLINNK